MSKKKEVGQCALCKTENVELMDSHIIPKLVYRRIKRYKNSRFRNYFNIKDIYQDGEKKPMLCSGCEGFLSTFETEFTNKFLDPYISNSKTKFVLTQFDDFIYSLNWKVIYDDLYVFKSFPEDKGYYHEMELALANYLNKRRHGKAVKPEGIKNYVFLAKDLKFSKDMLKELEPSTFGYCFDSDFNSKYFILTYFLGIIIVTVYEPKNILIISSISELIKRKLKTGKIKYIVREEMIWQYEHMMSQKPINDDILMNGLGDQIKKRYDI